jgi:hypothetical protein
LQNSTFIPERFLGPPDGAGAAEGDVTGRIEQERATLRVQLNELVNKSRAKRTMDNLRNPVLQLISYAASRHLTLPLSTAEFALYGTKLAFEKDNVGAVSRAMNAASFLAEYNDWSIVYTKGVAAAPLSAMRRTHRRQTKKSAGLTLKMVKRLMNHFGKACADKAADKQCDFAFSTAVCIGFKLLLRYNDLSRCRWDKGFCEIFPSHIRFYLDGRKNSQHKGNMLDLATPRHRARRGIYHMVLRAHRMFKTGFVLPHVDGRSKTIDQTRCMSYEKFVKYLRTMLVRIGVPATRARKYAAQSMRSGGATSAVIGNLSPPKINHLAGVKDVNWLVGYERKRLASRLRTSRAVGL